MYRVGRRTHHRYHRLGVFIVCVLIIMGASVGVHGLLHATKPPTTAIHNTSAHNTVYRTNATAEARIDTPLLSFQLPIDWQVGSTQTITPAPTYTYRSPNAQGQQVAIYVDTIPATLAVNRVVTVSAKGDSVDHDTVSDNCTTFTLTSGTTAATGVAAGKWQGTNFLCDVGNYQRDVVGITSSEGINVITLTGKTTGVHKLFLTYTDNDNNPDFNILYSILSTLKLK